MAISKFQFKKLTHSTQILIFAILVGCMGSLFYFYYLQDLVKERNALAIEIARLKTVVSQATAAEIQLKAFKQKLSQLDEELARLRTLLPAQKETPTVLRSVQQMAASSNLKILKFIPQPILNHDFYSDWPITIEVEGNYNGLGTFFEKVGKATRLINVGSITVRGLDNSMDPSKTLSSSCTATTFVFREEQVLEPDNNIDTKTDKNKNKTTPNKKAKKR